MTFPMGEPHDVSNKDASFVATLRRASILRCQTHVLCYGATMDLSFSKRHGLEPAAPAVRTRHEAPEALRLAVIQIPEDQGVSPSTLRDIICRVLHEAPDSSNWSEYPNVWGEVHLLIRGCAWNRVYDIAEAVYKKLRGSGFSIPETAKTFERELTDILFEQGIGWQMIGGRFQIRGDEEFERLTAAAVSDLERTGRARALSELHEAIADLSKRPRPDKTGAVQHAMAALEAVMRDVCGDAKPTLGELLKRYGERLVPKPLDTALSQVWGMHRVPDVTLAKARMSACAKRSLSFHFRQHSSGTCVPIQLTSSFSS